MPAPQPTTLTNILLPTSSSQAYDITISDSTITHTIPHQSTTTTPPSLLLPTLCHPHIHLDKPYLLTSNNTHLPSHTLPPCCDSDPTPLPSYTDLTPQSGTFPEALTNTSTAKTRFTKPDLFLRGSQLLAQSYTSGVTSARCFVEVDHVTNTQTLEVGLALKRIFEGSNPHHTRLIRVQICAFAQDPIFSTPHGLTNRTILSSALSTHTSPSNSPLHPSPGIEVLGTTPYVETSHSASISNITWAITTALTHNLHLDFHLDYNLTPTPSNTGSSLLVWDVIRLLRLHCWPTYSSCRGSGSSGGGSSSNNKTSSIKTIVLGHCTALTMLSHAALVRLSKEIKESDLPIYFVGLPTSDLYMMGRPDIPSKPSEEKQGENENGNANEVENSHPQNANHQNFKDNPQNVQDESESESESAQQQPMLRPRAILNPILLHQEYGVECVLGVNNVGNAFTPYGSCDPLQLASLGTGLYHAGTSDQAEMLLGCVSWRARDAIGLGDEEGEDGESRPGGGKEAKVGMKIDEFGLLVVENEEWVGCPGVLGMKVPGRRRVGVRDVVWDVPEVRLRRVVR